MRKGDIARCADGKRREGDLAPFAFISTGFSPDHGRR
jgi:hypothetical protein